MQIEDTKPRWGILSVLILALAVLGGLPFFLFRSKTEAPPFQIRNFAGKVEVIEEHDREIHAITFAIKLPSIIRSCSPSMRAPWNHPDPP